MELGDDDSDDEGYGKAAPVEDSFAKMFLEMGMDEEGNNLNGEDDELKGFEDY